MTAAQEAAIRKHGECLLAIFPNATERDPVALYKRLRLLEGKAHAIALRLCNGPAFEFEDQADRKIDGILDSVHQLLAIQENDGTPNVFVNRDPRGYALKISHAWCASNPGLPIHRDWGGYGIVAPDIDVKGNA